MSRKFISIIWGYHSQIFLFDRKQNYHMLPLEVMSEEGYKCEIYAIDSRVKIEEDPNFVPGVNVVYHKGIFSYLKYLFVNRNSLIYSNSLTLLTLIVGIIAKRTVFYPHSYPFGHTALRGLIIRFFYRFFTKVRINNADEFEQLQHIRANLPYICPLAISDDYLNQDLTRRSGAAWIGNLTEIKNPFILIETALLLKAKNIDFCIYVIGEDRFNRNGSNFSQLVQSYLVEDYIKLLGVLSHVQIKEILGKTSVFINTSISEGQCLGVYEGALAGNFLFLPKILAFPSVFGDFAKYHSSSRDLASNIMHFLDNNSDCHSSIKSIQDLILKKYSYDEIRKETKRMFLSI